MSDRTKKVPLVPVVGDIWEEKYRPARTVTILEVGWRVYKWGQRVREVTYHTLTTPAKKPQDYDTVTDMATFQKRFKKHYSGLEDL